jgi:hypothetical protein
MLENIAAAPADPILGLNDKFLSDSRSHKINLGVGVYKDDSGNTPVLRYSRQRRLRAGRSAAAVRRRFIDHRRRSHANRANARRHGRAAARR